jgi:predicted dehydrogenase
VAAEPVTSFRWGVFGTGMISMKFVAGLAAAPGHAATLVASRSRDSAERFAAGMGVSRAIAGYAEAATAGGVDAVYIATPPSEHAAHALLCIEAGLPVLVEKPFAASAADARRIADAARARGVFAMEAVWTRFLPASRALKDMLAAGELGEVRMASGSFATSKRPDPADGALDPARGGGAMAHLGVYPLSLGQWLFGTPLAVQAAGRIGDSGVDEDAAFQIGYAGGITASFQCSNRAWGANDFRVMGSEGAAAFAGPIFRPSGLFIVRQRPRGPAPARFDWKAKLREGGAAQRLAQITGLSSRAGATLRRIPYAGNGYHYQALEVAACIARGATESAIMPLADSIAVADTADRIRAQIHGGAA